MEKILDWMVLSQLPGIGVVGFWSLIKRFGSPGEVLRRTEGQLREAGLRQGQLDGFIHKDRVRRQCLVQAERLGRAGGRCLAFTSEGYPETLRQIADAPPVLYVLGDHHLLSGCCIAMVGSRSSTSYGNRTAFNLARKLAENGVTVLSGLALGIDTEAHRGTLAAGGKTIAVLGCGVDVVYPRQNGKLYREIIANGAIVSEYPLGTTPEGFRFPARNRIIAGMSRGVVVVEAARKSGSLITAQLAMNEGREVYAVPGQVDSYKSEGSHWLLRQGATLVQSEQDILQDLDLCGLSPQVRQAADEKTPAFLAADARALLQHVEAYGQPRNYLMQQSGLQAPVFNELLLLLELDGLIEILPGDEIRRLS